MRLKIRKPIPNNKGSFDLQEVKLEDIVVDKYSILSIDGSTSNSGLAIIRECDGGLLYTISAARETRKDEETPVRYKIALKRTVLDILSRNKFITQIYYEEPVVHNITAVSSLFMLRSFIEELIIENEPDFNYIKHYEISNMKWKKDFLAPDKIPSGTENQKKAVKDKVLNFLPFLDSVTQDEIDAIAMGFVAASFLKKGNDGAELQSKKKARPFKYNIKFIGADEDEGMMHEFYNAYDGPEKILENGIGFFDITGKTKFDQFVYNTMGQEDKVLVIKFASKYHGDLILKHRVGHLAAQYDYMYALVWRVTRKYN